MPPPADLTAYLNALAAEVGYDLDLHELDPTTGFHPHRVLAWALAGARHAGLSYARSLLTEPAEFLREQVGAEDSEDGVALHAGLLADLLAIRDRIDADLTAAAGAYTAACQALADTGSGLAWMRTPQLEAAGPTPARRGAQRLADVLTAAGYTSTGLPGPGPGGWTRTLPEGSRIVLTHSEGDTAVLHVEHADTTGWQASFTTGTPPQVLLAAIHATTSPRP